jgi:hypothetical protein
LLHIWEVLGLNLIIDSPSDIVQAGNSQLVSSTSSAFHHWVIILPLAGITYVRWIIKYTRSIRCHDWFPWGERERESVRERERARVWVSEFRREGDSEWVASLPFFLSLSCFYWPSRFYIFWIRTPVFTTGCPEGLSCSPYNPCKIVFYAHAPCTPRAIFVTGVNLLLCCATIRPLFLAKFWWKWSALK